MWYYQNKEFTSEMIGDYVGFVYCLEDKRNGKKYIGKKLFKSMRKLPPLKGKKRRRTKVIESDWKTYCGSSELTQQIVEEHGLEAFEREILHLCKSKGEMSYLELVEQVERKVLLSDDYYNNIIQVKIHGNHVKRLTRGESSPIL